MQNNSKASRWNVNVVWLAAAAAAHSDTAYAKCENERVFCETLRASSSLMTERKHTV